MSFICQQCHAPQPPGISPVMKVVETRQKKYVNTILDEEEREKVLETTGLEIVREMRLCPTCSNSELVTGGIGHHVPTA